MRIEVFGSAACQGEISYELLSFSPPLRLLDPNWDGRYLLYCSDWPYLERLQVVLGCNMCTFKINSLINKRRVMIGDVIKK